VRLARASGRAIAGEITPRENDRVSAVPLQRAPRGTPDEYAKPPVSLHLPPFGVTASSATRSRARARARVIDFPAPFPAASPI